MTKWSNTLKQCVSNLVTNYVGLALKGLTNGLTRVNFWKLRGYIKLKVGGLKLIPNYGLPGLFAKIGLFRKTSYRLSLSDFLRLCLLIDISDICKKMQTWRRIVNLLHGIADTQGKETNIVHFIMQPNTQNVVKRNQVLSLFRIFLKELKLIELRHSNEKKVRFPVTS